MTTATQGSVCRAISAIAAACLLMTALSACAPHQAEKKVLDPAVAWAFPGEGAAV
jgi:hypothetical protein